MNAVASRNVKFISHSDQGGRGDGVQIMVHRGYAYIGHGYSNGITVLDVRDLKNPKPVAFLPCPNAFTSASRPKNRSASASVIARRGAVCCELVSEMQPRSQVFGIPTENGPFPRWPAYLNNCYRAYF